MIRRSRSRLRGLGYVVSVLVVLGLWQLLSSRAIIPLLFPSPLSTLHVGLELARKGQLQADLWASLGRILAGFALGSAVGVVLGSQIPRTFAHQLAAAASISEKPPIRR